MTSGSGSDVERVETASAVLALPAPLRVGNATITRREYSAVRVRTRDGLVGKSYCLSRDAPMTDIVDRLISPHVIGHDSDDVPAIWERVFRATAIVGRVGLVRRALGLVDIALWDIAAQRRGVPVWQLLGKSGQPRPAMLVAAYPTADRTARELAADVLRHAADGWPLLKIARSPDRALMRELLARVTDGLPPTTEIVVDASFGWADADDALADLRGWRVPALAWLEDPLLPEDAQGCARIRHEGGVRVGVGDEVTDPLVFRRLLDADALDVVRIDVVAIGGITPATRLIEETAGHGLPYSCHVYPEVTVHLGVGVETFERGEAGNPYDPAPLLVTGGPEFRGGTAIPPTAPGLGFDVDSALFDFTAW